MSQFALRAFCASSAFQDLCLLKSHQNLTTRIPARMRRDYRPFEVSSILPKLRHYRNSLFLDAGCCAEVPGHE
jgi:hypothetical protein